MALASGWSDPAFPPRSPAPVPEPVCARAEPTSSAVMVVAARPVNHRALMLRLLVAMGCAVTA